MTPTSTPARQRLAAFSSACLLAAVAATPLTWASEGGQAVPSAGEASAAAQPVARETARIRLFGQNGVMVDFFQNSACYGGGAKAIRVSGGVGDAFSSFLGSPKNVSVGMKDTPNTTNIAKRNGIFSKAYFREYEIAANQPVSLKMAFQNAPAPTLTHVSVGGVTVTSEGATRKCSNLGGTFTPQAGKDYEVALDVHGGQCTAVVREIQSDDSGAVKMQDIAIAPTPKCS